MLVGEIAVTPWNTAGNEDPVVTGAGTATWLQARPLKCRTAGIPFAFAPTAQTSVLESAAMAVSVSAGLKAGLATMLHLAPFQCSTRPEVPTAKRLLAEMAATPSNCAPSTGEGFGLATMLHCVPFQCSIKGTV